MKYPSYCCQKCGEQIGLLGRIFRFLHECVSVENEFETFKEVDDALYKHETPYYYAAARGMVKDDFSDEWYERREKLTREWYRLHP